MLLILLLGTLAIVTSLFGLFLRRRGGYAGQGGKTATVAHLSTKQQEMVDLFAARLRSGAIGIPDLIRLLKKEGRDPREVSEALLVAMARFPKFATRRDKFDGWIAESQRQI